MNITVIDNIKKQYIEALSKDLKYNEVLKSVLSRKENEPISHFSSLNPDISKYIHLYGHFQKIYRKP